MSDTQEIPTVASEKRRTGLAYFFVRLVKEKPLGAFFGMIVLLFLLTGIFADWLAPYGMNESHPIDRLLPPSTKYFLGVDNLGRDIFSRVIFGARISMIVGIAAGTMSILVASLIGVLSGYFGGKFDMVVQRFVDGWICFPSLILYLAAMSVVGPGMWQVIIAIGLVQGIDASRIMRSAVINIRENMYVNAAVAIGSPTTKTIARHILPNTMPAMIILFSTQVPIAILSEAALSFLGFGIPPPQPSWGGMLTGSGRSYMFRAPWMALWPGLAISIVAYSINMFGDAVRDLLDPKLRGSVGGLGAHGVKLAKKAKARHIGKSKIFRRSYHLKRGG